MWINMLNAVKRLSDMNLYHVNDGQGRLGDVGPLRRPENWRRNLVTGALEVRVRHFNGQEWKTPLGGGFMPASALTIIVPDGACQCDACMGIVASGEDM